MNIDNLEIGQTVLVQLKPDFEIGDLVRCKVGESEDEDGRILVPVRKDTGYNYFEASDIDSLSVVEETLAVSARGPKYDGGKPDWTLLPMFAIEEVVRVLDFGASKYYRGSWRKVPEAKRRYIAAAYRHFMDYYFRGIVNDEESGMHHLAHAACCVLFVLQIDLRGPDDVEP